MTEGQGGRRRGPPLSGQPHQGGSVVRPLLRGHVPGDRLVAGHLHVPDEQVEAHPDQGIKPVDAEGQIGQQLPNVVPIAEMGPLVGQGYGPLRIPQP